MASDISPVRARVGLIIPSSNRLTEPQFCRYAPAGVQTHVTRLRMTGPHHAPLLDLLPRIVEAAGTLSDAKCDVIVFHCTGSSMEAGLAAEQQVIQSIAASTGTLATTTASAILAAFEALAVERLVLVSPYAQDIHQHELDFLAQAGMKVVRDRALGLAGSDAYIAAPPDLWQSVVEDEADERADGYFLSCTNTHMIEVIESLEAQLGRPVITSNQATLWYCLRLLGIADRVPGLGRLSTLDPSASAQPRVAVQETN